MVRNIRFGGASARSGAAVRAGLRGAVTAAVLCGLLALGGCSAVGGEAATESSAAEGSSGESAADTSSTAVDVSAMDLEFTDRDLDASYDAASATSIALSDAASTVTGAGASVDGSTVTISQAGVYVLSGALSDGRIVVEATDQDKIQLVFDGVSVHSGDDPAVYVKQANKVFVTLAEGTSNTLSDSATYTLEEGTDEPNAALFSKDDLTINGTGSLEVAGSYAHAVNSKDDLVITGGTLTVTAVEDGLRGRDCVKIAGGTFDVTAGADAIKSSNDEDGTRGFVLIGDGSFSITAGDDAVHAESALFVNGGQVEVALCVEGLEAEQIYMNDGDVYVTSSDDAVNAAARGSSTPDAVGAAGGGEPGDGAVGGEIPEGGLSRPEGDPGASGGAAGDGVPGEGGGQAAPSGDGAASVADAPAAADAASGAPISTGGAAAGGFPTASSSSSCLIQINGGRLVLDAGGDGLDSNGSIEITGGVVLVQGPSSDDDAALDYETTAEISGGTVVMVGSAGMAEGFSGGAQASVSGNVSGSAGDTACVTDSDGNVLASFTAKRAFQWALLSGAGMTEGDTFKVVVGGTVANADADGFAASGTVSGGTSTEVTAAVASSSGFAGAGGGASAGGGTSAGNPGAQGQAPMHG